MNIRSFLRFPGACGVTCGLATALLTGCGGGGGGSNSPTPTPGTTPGGGSSNILLSDGFNGSSLDQNLWGIYTADQTLQRTKFGITPQIINEGGTTYARMRLESFNASAPGTFKGTEIFTKQRFPRGNGLEMTARLRAPGLPPGLILAFFGIYDRYTDTSNQNDTTYRKDEIDYEILTAQQEQFSPAGGRNRLYLNTWNNWNLSNRFDEDDENNGSERLNDDKTYGPSKTADYDYANWNTYTIRWYPDRIEFYVNGVLERTENEVNPTQDLSVHFNIWTGMSDFRQAYSASLQPASSQADSKTYTFDVDYVTVTNLGATSARTARKIATPPAANLKSYRSR